MAGTETAPAVEKAALWSSIAIYVFGTVGTLLVLMVVLAAGQHHGLTEEQQAQLASIDLSGYVAGTIIAVATFRLVSWRVLLVTALGFVIVFNLAGHMAETFTQIAATRFLVELGSGLAIALGMAAFADTHKPDRSYAIALALVMLSSFVILLVLPGYLETLGPGVVYNVHIAWALFVLPFVLWFPKGTARDTTDATSGRTLSGSLIAALIAVFLYMLAEGGVWAMAAVIGENIGMSNSEVGNILAYSLLASFIGAVIASWLSTRYGRLWPVIIGLLLFGGSLFFLLFDTPLAFAIGICVSQGLFGFLPPYLALTCMDHDTTGRYAVFIPTIQILGYALSPGIASAFVEPWGLAASVVGVAVAATAVCLLLSIPLSRALDRHYQGKAVSMPV